MSVFAGHGDITPLQIWNGVVGHAIEGDRTTLAIVELAPNCAIPEHRHENEQLGVCITGIAAVPGRRRAPRGRPRRQLADPR